MVIRIRRPQPRASGKGAQMCFSLIIWYVFVAIGIGFFRLPKAIVYFGDLMNLWLFFCAVRFKHFRVERSSVLLVICLFALEATVSGFANLKSPLLFLWGIRQNFRFFIFYYSCTAYLKREDYDVLFHIVKWLFWISLPLCIYEALFVNYPVGTIVGDMVGGIYYGIQGVNAPLNIVMIIHVAKTFIDYYGKRVKFSNLTMTIVAAMVMAAFAELKIFLIEIIIIAGIVMVCNGVSLKSMMLCALGAVSAGAVIQMFVRINGGGRAYYTTDYLSIGGMLTNAFRASGYDGAGDLNRFFAIQTLTQMFFQKDMLGFLVGLGLGNAEYAGFSFLTSAFYNEYGWLHYQYFSVSFIFIETGILGVLLYFGIFISAAMQGRSFLQKGSDLRIFYMIMVIMMLIMIFYNPALRNEQCGFMLYMILAMPVVARQEKQLRRKASALED